MKSIYAKVDARDVSGSVIVLRGTVRQKLPETEQNIGLTVIFGKANQSYRVNAISP
jgi:hypothetical protein